MIFTYINFDKPGLPQEDISIVRTPRMATEAWEVLPVRCDAEDTTEEFAFSAKIWLKDKSELCTSIIESADWQEVYAHFFSEEASIAPE